MMYVEDLIVKLSMIVLFREDRSIVNNFCNHIANGIGFTDKQRGLALRLCKKYNKALSDYLKVDTAAILNCQEFFLPLRKLSETKIISIKDGKKLSVTFPYNQGIIEKIQTYKMSLPRIEAKTISWNAAERNWEFGLSEGNILFVSSFLPMGFVADEQFQKFLEDILAINIEEYVPLIIKNNREYSFANVAPTVPKMNTPNLIKALITGRRYGINYWDDTIDTELKSGEYADALINFFENRLEQDDRVYLEDLSPLLQHSSNVLIVIPGGDEFKIVNDCCRFIYEKDSSAEIAVLFRLDNKKGKSFNEYVKTNEFNRPITDTTKYIFVSGKLPKPLLESNKHFDAVIQFGSTSAHYSLRNFVKSHHNVIYIKHKFEQKEFTFA